MVTKIQLMEALKWALENAAELSPSWEESDGPSVFRVGGCGCCADYNQSPPAHLQRTFDAIALLVKRSR